MPADPNFAQKKSSEEITYEVTFQNTKQKLMLEINKRINMVTNSDELLTLSQALLTLKNSY